MVLTTLRLAILLFSAALTASASRADTEPCFTREPGPIQRMIERLTLALDCPECAQVATKCPLSRLENPPPIYIAGEDHLNPDSTQSKARLFELARRGKIELATEVGFYNAALPWSPQQNIAGISPELSSPHIHGIESPVAHALIASYGVQRGLLLHGPTLRLVDDLGLYIVTEPLFRGAYEDLRAKRECPECFRAMDSFLTFLKTKSKPYRTPDQDAEILKILKSVPEKRLSEFMTALHVRTLDLAKEVFPKKLKDIDLLPLLRQEDESRIGIGGYGTSLIVGSSMQKLVMDLRNREFTGRIADLICAQSGKSEPLIILVGNDHVEGLMKLLDGLSTHRLQPGHFRTFAPLENAQLFNQLQPQLTH